MNYKELLKISDEFMLRVLQETVDKLCKDNNINAAEKTIMINNIAKTEFRNVYGVDEVM